MRLFFRALICWLCFAYGVSSYAQSPIRINLEYSQAPLKAVLDSLQADYAVQFAYESALVGKKEVTVRLKNASLKSALKKLLGPHNIDFKIVDQQFVILTQGEIPSLQEASQISLTGRVIDVNTGQALPFAGVLVKHQNRGVYANAKGQFSIKGPFGPSDTLGIQYVGYKDSWMPLAEVLHTPSLEIALEQDIQTLEDVEIVKEAMKPVDFLPQSLAFSYRPEKIGILPGWGEPDVFRALQLLPGISSTDESANLHVRGGTPDQNLILWDGIPVYHNAHFFGLFSAVNPYIIDSANIYRGGFGANYGSRVSAVLDIHSKPNNIDRFHGSVHLNLLSLEGNFEFPAKKIKSEFLFSFRRAYSDVIQSSFYKRLFDKVFQQGLIFDDLKQRQNGAEELSLRPLFRYYDLNAKWNFRPNPKTDISLSLYAGEDILDYTKEELFEEIPPQFSIINRLNDGNGGYSLKWSQSWSDNFSSRVQLIHSNFDHNYQLWAQGPVDTIIYARFDQYNNLKESILRIDTKWQASEKVALHMGWSSSTTEVGINFYGEEGQEVQYDEEYRLESSANAVYIQAGIQHHPKFSTDLGLRMSQYTLTGESFLSPRLSLFWQPKARWNITGHIGHYVQFASHIVESNPLKVSDVTWILANGSDFEVVQSTQFSLGTNYQKGNFSMGVDVYAKSLQGLTTASLLFNRGNNDFGDGKGEVNGLDIFFSQKWGKYTTWLSYSLGKVLYRFDAINDALPFPASYDQKHSLKWTHLWDAGPWHASASLHVGSGRPFTEGKMWEFINDEGKLDAFLYAEGRNDLRLPTYHRVDVAISRDFSIGKEPWHKGKFGISIFNLYNRRNVQDIQYLILPPEPEEEIYSHRLIQTQRQLLGVTPNLFLHLEW